MLTSLLKRLDVLVDIDTPVVSLTPIQGYKLTKLIKRKRRIHPHRHNYTAWVQPKPGGVCVFVYAKGHVRRVYVCSYLMKTKVFEHVKIKSADFSDHDCSGSYGLLHQQARETRSVVEDSYSTHLLHTVYHRFELSAKQYK